MRLHYTDQNIFIQNATTLYSSRKFMNIQVSHIKVI